MLKYAKYILLALLVVVLAVGGWYLGFRSALPKRVVEEDATVVLDRIEKVCKLVAVEGHLSEVYDYKDYKFYDVWPLRKKALVRVKARVSVGYDFEQMAVHVDSSKRIVRILHFPEPEILSLEHDLDYYDFSEGIFNVFTEGDYNQLQKRAKTFIEQKARETDLFEQAETQKEDLLETIRLLASGMGWEVRVEPTRQRPSLQG